METSLIVSAVSVAGCKNLNEAQGRQATGPGTPTGAEADRLSAQDNFLDFESPLPLVPVVGE